MKVEEQKRKFIRNILIGVIALFIVSFIINTAPGYKRNKYKNVINLVIEDQNVTEKLKKKIYKDESGSIYLSKDDVKEFLDKTIYYDEENKTIIATSAISVASMKIGEKSININGVIDTTLDTVIYKDNTIYIPIEEIKEVYNIEVNYLKDENIVIIDRLNKGMIKAEADEKTKIKFKPRALSKDIGTLQIGDRVSAFYTTSKGWRLIRTETGLVGYVKANTLTNEYILRQDMGQGVTTKVISQDIQDEKTINIDGKNILIKGSIEITDDGMLLKDLELDNDNENTITCVNLRLRNANIDGYENRSKLIKNIVNFSRKNNVKGINVIVDNKDINLERFVIELTPSLREIGIITNVVVSSEIDTNNYKDIVNYIIQDVI